jgi:hypothetical protein
MARVGASIRFREVAGLTAYARNARTHSEEQVLEIAASMREWEHHQQRRRRDDQGWTVRRKRDSGG